MQSAYLLNYPSFNKHLIPSHRQAGAPVILLYFEELREVARRRAKQALITLPLIRLKGREKQGEREGERPTEKRGKTERESNRERVRERERGTQWKVFCCAVIRLSCCWLQSGTTEGPKCRRLLTGLAPRTGVCYTHMFVHCSKNLDSLSIRALGEGREEAAAKELPQSSSSASRPSWQVRRLRNRHQLD